MGYAVNKTPHPWSHKSKAKERQRIRWRSDSKGLLFCDIRNVVSVCVQDINGSFFLPRRKLAQLFAQFIICHMGLRTQRNPG